ARPARLVEGERDEAPRGAGGGEGAGLPAERHGPRARAAAHERGGGDALGPSQPLLRGGDGRDRHGRGRGGVPDAAGHGASGAGAGGGGDRAAAGAADGGTDPGRAAASG